MKIFLYLFLYAFIIILTSCNSNKNNIKKEIIVPYKIATGYFVKNTVDSSTSLELKIEIEKDFNNLFGYATVMGSNGKPTGIDFSKEYVIAIVKKDTNRETTLEPISFISKDNKLTLSYIVKTGLESTYTTKPLLILVINKKYKGEIIYDTMETKYD